MPVTPRGASSAAEVVRDLLERDVHVVDADRHAGDRARLGVALPERALLLDAAERGVQVGDVHAGAHVLERVAAQAAAVRARHARRVAAGGGRGDELAERTVVHRRLEAVERLAHVEEEAEEHAELGDRLELAQAGLRDERTTALEEPRQLGSAESLRELVGARVASSEEVNDAPYQGESPGP